MGTVNTPLIIRARVELTFSARGEFNSSSNVALAVQVILVIATKAEAHCNTLNEPPLVLQ